MNEPWIYPALSVVLALGIAAPAVGLFGLLRQSPQGWLPARVVLAALPLVAGFCAAAAAHEQPTAVWLPFALLAGVCGLFCVLRSERLARGAAAFGRVATSRRWQAACLLVAGPLLAAVWTFRLKEPRELPPQRAQDPTESLNTVRAFEEVIPTPLCTDRGRPVRVHRQIYRSASDDKLDRLQTALLRRLGLEGRVIALPSGSVSCDCAGWVFTGGQYWLVRQEPTAILEDNGYRHVEEPRPGDLVIYRNRSGEAIHYGLVRVAQPDMPVLVESKWGDCGVFLHPIAAHPYPDVRPCFYRSARPSHLLRGADQAPSFPTDSRNGPP
jgi:hypothetical protein